MNVPEDVKKWLASLDKKQAQDFLLWLTARFAEDFLLNKLRGR